MDDDNVATITMAEVLVQFASGDRASGYYDANGVLWYVVDGGWTAKQPGDEYPLVVGDGNAT